MVTPRSVERKTASISIKKYFSDDWKNKKPAKVKIETSEVLKDFFAKTDPSRSSRLVSQSASSLLPAFSDRSSEDILRNAYLKLNSTHSTELRSTGEKYDTLISQRTELQKNWVKEKSALQTLQAERQQIAGQRWKPGKHLLLHRLDKQILVVTQRCSKLEEKSQNLIHQIKQLESNRDLHDVLVASQILAVQSNSSGKSFLKSQPQNFSEAVKLLEDDDLVLKNWAGVQAPDSGALTLNKAGEAYDQLLARKREYHKAQGELQASLASAQSITSEGVPALFVRRFKQDQREAVLSIQQSLLAVQEKLKSVEKKMSALRAANPELDQLLSTWDFLGKDQISYQKVSQEPISQKKHESTDLDSSKKIERKKRPSHSEATQSFPAPSRSLEAGTSVKPNAKVEAVLEIRNRGLVESKNDVLIIGDSIASHMRDTLGREVGFVGRSGLPSSEILQRLRANPDALKNRKMVIINAGGNDVSNKNTESIIANIDAMVKMAKEAGVPKIVVLTRIPYERAYGSNKVTANMPQLAEALRDKYGNGKIPNVQLVDLNKELADEQGRLPQRYENEVETTDKLHPYKAYRPALRIISKKVNEPVIAEWISGSKRRSAG